MIGSSEAHGILIRTIQCLQVLETPGATFAGARARDATDTVAIDTSRAGGPRADAQANQQVGWGLRVRRVDSLSSASDLQRQPHVTV